MILFPLAATLEVTNATIAIYDEDKGPASIELTQQFAKASGVSDVLLIQNRHDVQDVIDNRKAPCCWCISLQNFQCTARRTETGTAAKSLLDGRNSNSAQIAANYVQQITAHYQQERMLQAVTSELVVRKLV